MGKEYYNDGENYVVVKEGDKQVDVYVGDSKSGDHCHWWFDKETNDSGIKHRGQCDDCSEGGGK